MNFPKNIINRMAASSFVLLAALGGLYVLGQGSSALGSPNVRPDKLQQFTSAADFKNYLARTNRLNGNQYSAGPIRSFSQPLQKGALVAPEAAGNAVADRISTTNVQVAGIDEPDIVKTDGQNIFASEPRYYYPLNGLRPKTLLMPNYPTPELYGSVNAIKALPASDLKLVGKIPVSGDLLLSGHTVMVFSGNIIYGYDVSDSANPKQLWKMSLGERSGLVGARLFNGVLYLATRESINVSNPCPYMPLSTDNRKIMIPCSRIYHPVGPVPTDSTFTVSSINIADGTVQKTVSFTGSSSFSQLYMSQSAVYVTYFSPGDVLKFSYDFLTQNKDIVPSTVISKIAKLRTYDISDGSKQNEFYFILNEWLGALSNDDLMKLQNELQNRLASYYPLHLRELEKTNIVKVGLSDFKLAGIGAVPGQLLNQYSLDEYQNNLRVAVTVGQNFWSVGSLSASTKTSNDVYVLDANMNTVGQVLDLGIGERIYSARFLGPQAYLVTFKQTDPFFVLDLTNPQHPSVAGELKVPGYSGYLEPMGNGVVLGVGKEDNKVKVALYSVVDPKNPQELSKFTLDEYWSEALNNPHAFLKDDKHKIFFIPGSQGGYVFSYANNQLSLAKAISGSVQRALYLDDTLYIVSQNGISAWDENTWAKLGEFTFVSTTLPTPPMPPPLRPVQ